MLGGRIAWRPAPTISLGAEAWRATLVNDLAVTGVGVRMAVTPWAGRGWGLDPALVFGIERLAADDDEDRGVAFVSGAGVRKDAGAWTIQAEVLHRQLTVDELAVDGVETARDATLWEGRLALGWIGG